LKGKRRNASHARTGTTAMSVEALAAARPVIEELARRRPGIAAVVTALEATFPAASLEDLAELLEMFREELGRRSTRRLPSFGP
jgi:hypothetical protein